MEKSPSNLSATPAPATSAQADFQLAELHRQHLQLQAKLAESNGPEQQAEPNYRSMFDNASHGIFQTTSDGRFLSCNPALARICGYDSPDDIKSTVNNIGKQLYIDPTARQRFAEMIGHGQVAGFEARLARKDGSIIWVSETARAVRNADGHILYYEGFVTDITLRKLAEERLRESEERYALAMRGANDGLWDWNLDTQQIHFSPRWKEMLGSTETQIGNTPDEWFSRIHPDDANAVKAAIAQHRDGSGSHFEIEHRMRHADSTYRWMLARGTAVRDESGRARRMAGSQTDITSRKSAEEQLQRDALRDSLTGLPNRALFSDRVERSISRMARDPGHCFAVLFVDVDRFKVINDSLGHRAGDELIIAFARRIGGCLRPSDTIARLGGDEFAILLDDARDENAAVCVAQRILDALKQPFSVCRQEVFATTSIGIAVSTGGYTKPEDIMRDADNALYRAKAAGKSRYEIFDSEMHVRAIKLLQVENDLRRAIDRKEFELHYQPILNMCNRRVRGFEALVRWRHPDRGLISPADFIPLAEETGLIVPIGSWVLGEACRQAAQWHRDFPNHPIDINVNLSGRQFSQSNLIDQVANVLTETGLPAKHLILEITESVVMENPESTIAMLHGLKKLGVQLNIDDFGTGYSSLAYLQKFPVDTMKIDRSFVTRLGEAENAEIVRTIVALAHNLNMKVTAEGIETAEQYLHLQNLSCENAQGFFLSKPLDSASAHNLLKASIAEGQAA